MKAKLLNSGLIITSCIGYLEWGNDMSMFLIQGEIEVITKAFSNISALAHPFIILPLLGQLFLLITLFQKVPNKIVTYTGMFCIAVLLAFIFLIGAISFHYKIALSTVPFFFFVFLTIRHYKQLKI